MVPIIPETTADPTAWESESSLRSAAGRGADALGSAASLYEASLAILGSLQPVSGSSRIVTAATIKALDGFIAGSLPELTDGPHLEEIPHSPV
jgi:hypothetical protein